MPQQLRHIQHRTHCNRSSRNRDEQQREAERRSLAEQNIRAAVQQITDRNRSLVIFKAQPLADPVRNHGARYETDSGEAPDHTDSRWSAMIYDLAEQTKQNLR